MFFIVTLLKGFATGEMRHGKPGAWRAHICFFYRIKVKSHEQMQLRKGGGSFNTPASHWHFD